jgi:hypothetical protein
MRARVWIGAVVVALAAGVGGLRAEPPCCPPPEDCFAKRLGPVGGWHPYGGGLLHWWPKACFPHCGGPDDYCRKPLPCVCWPPYPPYYIWGPPDVSGFRPSCRPTGGDAR